MSEILVAEQQLELVNIVQVVQTNLSKNFSLILKRLNHHDQVFAQYQIDRFQQKTEQQNQILRLQKQILNNKILVSQQFQDIASKVQTLQSNYSNLQAQSFDNIGDLRRLNNDLLKGQSNFQQLLKQKQLEIMQIVEHVNLLGLEQNRLNDQINKKENRVQAERIIKETQILKDKNQFIESQLKIAHHKIQKMEILNQKAQRLQAKKQVEIFKQIQQRVQKELKSKIGSTVINGYQPLTSFALIQGKKGTQTPLSGYNTPPILDNEQSQSERSKQTKKDQEENTVNSVGNIGNIDLYMQKNSEKMKAFEIQLKEIKDSLKNAQRNLLKKQSENKQNSSQGIKQKLNEIKPQIVKLWAKLDTVDDRVTFNQRKLDQKVRGINELTAIMKDNNVSRLQEKMKNTHTEFFASLKEIKAKLEVKINQSDHDKYCQTIQQKFSHINELIFLKSDKLQVKKALLFLESKIKQIILVISQDESNEKDALLTKKQLKCISCDKQLDRFTGMVSNSKGNWDGLPLKDHPPEILGRFGMTSYGSLSKKLKRLQNKDLPILNKKGSTHNSFVAN